MNFSTFNLSPILLSIFTHLAVYTSSIHLAQAQRDMYFGHAAGLSISDDGKLTPLEGSKMLTDEGCALQYNELGELLFYTNGVSVWDSRHQVLKNGTGLMGGESASHSALICPRPGQTDEFFLFTINDLTGSRLKEQTGLRFSLIKSDGEEGYEVDENSKNVLIQEFVGEKMALTPHGNGIDFWLLVRSELGFKSYLVTSNGVEIKEKSHGSDKLLSQKNERSTLLHDLGQFKISSDGRYAAAAMNFKETTDPSIELMRFDPCSGDISDRLNLSVKTRMKKTKVYGVAFSPKSNELFITAYSLSDGGMLLKYSLDNWNEQDVQASRQSIYEGQSRLYALQFIDNQRALSSSDHDRGRFVGLLSQGELGWHLKTDAIRITAGRSVASLPSFLSIAQDELQDNYLPDTSFCLGSHIELELPEYIDLITPLQKVDNKFVINQEGIYEYETSSYCQKVVSEFEVYSKNCDQECSLKFPLAFTPNGDGRNDSFGPVNQFDCTVTDYNMVIRSRSGSIMFQSKSPEDTWDGNRADPMEVYVVSCIYRIDGTSRSFVGDVTVVH